MRKMKPTMYPKWRGSIDPLRYLANTMLINPAIPKYIINASGDDFFVPDNNNTAYYSKLPGKIITPYSAYYEPLPLN